MRRSNRTFKRPKKYFEDEMIVEEEAFIFDGNAIERMFKNQQKSGVAGASKEKMVNAEKRPERDSRPPKRNDNEVLPTPKHIIHSFGDHCHHSTSYYLWNQTIRMYSMQNIPAFIDYLYFLFPHLISSSFLLF